MIRALSILVSAILANTAEPATTREAVLIRALVLAAGLDRIAKPPSPASVLQLRASTTASAPIIVVLIRAHVLAAGLEWIVKPPSIHASATLVNTAGPAPTREAVLIRAHVLAAGLE